MLRKPDHNFCTGFPLCHWLFFPSVQLSLDARKISVNGYVLGGLRYDISGPQAGSRTNSRVTGGFLYAATNSLKRFTVITFRISKYIFIEATSKSNFRNDFLSNKEAKIFKKPPAHIQKVLSQFLSPSKKIHLLKHSF